MKTALRMLACALPLASLTATMAPASAAPAFTPRDALERQFDLEGKPPYAAPYDGTLRFSALDAKYDSGHGHGYRNEFKIADKLRRPAAQTHEHFAARVTAQLPDGAKTIVAQYHVEGLDTIVKVYVQDTADRQGLDGKPDNGVFDILVRMLGTDGKEATTALGTVRSGQPFDLDVRFDGGDARVAVTGPDGVQREGHTRIKPDERAIYFKFGDYLQALDPDTGKHTISSAQWDRYYAAKRITAEHVVFSNTVFEREGPQP
ncbi:polysaccharide lyase family 7 protein [Massilia forsythiae]|uniref:Polysaccharide lyase family 7 protein n=1 Tax=Massilia forsythiae TaxID=2728020 RepID=A0A7Z2VZ52_9BURK|nr:polysaccharide lyase family 7 protein [Massilia forsythiae]QJE02057.1 polysaccharide lyase family 7 protein [Massilia forsythiae]